jgi:hypothetical protein
VNAALDCFVASLLAMTVTGARRGEPRGSAVCGAANDIKKRWQAACELPRKRTIAMVHERSAYSLADLPADLWSGDGNEFDSPSERTMLLQLRGIDLPRTTLGSFGTSWSPVSENLDEYSPAFSEQSAGENAGRGKLRTAFVQGLGVVGDAATSNPIGFAIGNDIKPIRPGHLIQRFEPEKEPGQRHHMWPPVQIDLPRFNAPQGAPQRIIDLINKSGLEDLVMQAIGAGRTMMGDANWYDTEWLRERFLEELGYKAGAATFDDFLPFIAATSPGSDVGTNIRNATRYFNKFRRGEDLGGDNPNPYGSWLADLHKKLAKAAAERRLDPLRQPKITSFAENLAGNHEPVTVDIHALRLLAMLARDANFLKREYKELLTRGELSMDEAVANPSYWRNPYANEYPTLEQFYKKLATRAKLSPAEAQAAAWLGGGHITGLKSNRFKSFRDHFEDRINRTAKDKGLSVEEVWRGFLRGELDLVLLDGQPNAIA